MSLKSIFRTKSIESIIEGSKNNSLKKTLGAFDLIMIAIGCTIGTGIFVLTGIGAAKYAGPAISISYLLAGLACMFAALAYTELASMVPVSGSAYTYTYAIMGEFLAWLVAWGLILEYTVAASTVSAGWSGYFVGALKTAGYHIPEYLTKVPSDGGIINLPAVLVAFFIGILLVRGTKESVMANRILVAVKLGVIFLFLIIAAPHIKTENYQDFFPFGWQGVGAGAAAIFFAYLGFDAVATTAEECKNPNRDLPIGIIGGLGICSILYILVSLALTGIVDYKLLDSAEPMALALRINGSNIGSALVAVGAIAGMLAVLLVLMYGQSRIFFVMSRDGLLPKAFQKIHPKYQTPYIGCFIVMIAVMLISGFTPIQTMGNMSSLGILFAFVIVSIGVVILRIKRPELERPFKCPAVYVVSAIAIISCSYLMFNLLKHTKIAFIIWFLLGIIVYFTYTFKRSPLNQKNN
jgi:APA family basic amino acid/polyamine antiporter